MNAEAISLGGRVCGCLLGGAIGDALGAPVEFDSIEAIRRRFGRDGIGELEPAYGRRGAITDDTQMTLFTAEGLLRAYTRGMLKGIAPDVRAVVDHAYGRWLATQGERSGRWDTAQFDGWLMAVAHLHDRRAPGNTCLAALHADRMGTMEEPLNDSKGCGGVMRIAPAGLLHREYFGDRFELGCSLAALTHGHPSGYLAAGALVEIIGAICDGRLLDQALDAAEAKLSVRRGHDEVLAALGAARALARSGERPAPEAIAQLGAGWVAEEALAISVYCALVATDYEHGVRLAVNHSGDSDSTGAITGNVLGALWGAAALPSRWLEQLEARETIEALCHDWVAAFIDGHADVESEEWWQRYPGW